MRRLLVIALMLLAAGFSDAQIAVEQLGSHDMTPGSASAVRGGITNACLYCHAPHGSMTAPTPLWNQQLSMQTYQLYSSSTYHQTGLQPPIGSPSKLCLSCHDGTVAVGQTVAYGAVAMTGGMKSSSLLGTNLQASHPFSLKAPLTDAPTLNQALLGAPPKTADPAVKLVNGTIECTTCHEPHTQYIDKIVLKFLVRDSSSSQLCLSCHDPNRVISGNPLSGWATSAHAMSSATTSNTPYVGGYGTVAQNGCSACHMPHNALGPARLLRGPDQQDCIGCHAGSNTQPAAPNVFAEMTNSTGVVKIPHPFPDANDAHDPTEPAVLNNNRHAGCVDCHNPHVTQATAAFSLPPAIRPSQANVIGVSAGDGITAINPAVNQYENCFRCHGTSSGKGASKQFNYGYLPVWTVNSGDPLNVIPQFSATATSSHPVTHDRSSVLPQPSLRAQMMQLDGLTPGRSMGLRILCTDCHNSDDNREFGGAGANGPHGSKFTHILERRYEMSQAAAPGAAISNLLPTPDLGPTGPYTLCAKCHDLSQIMSNSSFTEHARHINDGFSCSTCHTAHGMGGQSPSVSGERMVNFDASVVAANGASPVAYSRASNSCSLVCHNQAHSLAGAAAMRSGTIKR